jgi:hypothetical protein
MERAAETGIASSGQASWPWRAAGVLATLAAGAALALIVAHWGWQWFGPAAQTLPHDDVSEPSAAAIAAAAPFGRAGASAPPAPAGALPASNAAPLQGETRLLGVFAGRDGEGYALLRLPERGTVLVRRGQDITNDVKLEAVYPNGIRIRDRGEARDIVLRQQAAPLAVPGKPVARSTVGANPAVRAACATPPGFSGSVFRLNAELLAGMAAQPESWAALLAPGSGALVVRDETGFAALLGMKTGDRVTQANGIGLSAIDDVLSAVVKPLVASQPVRLSGVRDGKPREWLFLNAGACPG